MCVWMYQNELVEPLLCGLYQHTVPNSEEESLNVHITAAPHSAECGQVYRHKQSFTNNCTLKVYIF